jgi:hypothetical protein
MHRELIALLFCLLPGVSGFALGQRIILIPKDIGGSADEVVVIGELSPVSRTAVREELKCEPKVAFIYEYFYLLHYKFHLWTWNGRFVLYNDEDDRYWEMPSGSLAKLLDPHTAESLTIPWSYRIPPGLAITLVIIAAIAIAGYRSASARAARLVKDPRYEQALQVYADGLRTDTEPTREEKKNALAAAVNYLQNDGIPAAKAEKSLRLLVGELERERSYDLRTQAAEFEEASEWEKAIEYYRRAADLREEWDPADYQFLLKCINRVRGKQDRSS